MILSAIKGYVMFHYSSQQTSIVFVLFSEYTSMTEPTPPIRVERDFATPPMAYDTGNDHTTAQLVERIASLELENAMLRSDLNKLVESLRATDIIALNNAEASVAHWIDVHKRLKRVEQLLEDTGNNDSTPSTDTKPQDGNTTTTTTNTNSAVVDFLEHAFLSFSGREMHDVD